MYKVLLKRVRRTVEEGLTIDSPSLFELLFHLIRYHLLTESDLSELWTLVVASSAYIRPHDDLSGVFLIDFIHKALLVLTL